MFVQLRQNLLVLLSSYVRDSNADLNVSTSTGLTVDDIAASLEIIPNGYKLINHTRTKLKGGGITLLHIETVTVLLS